MHIEIWWFLVFVMGMAGIRMVQSITLALISRRKQSGPALPGDLETRMARIEQIVESTSYEVERIGEAQRFLTKVLTDGRQSAPPATPRRESSGSGSLS
jgi:hypothetical protein